MNQSAFKKILNDAIVGVYKNHTFHDVYPNFKPLKDGIVRCQTMICQPYTGPAKITYQCGFQNLSKSCGFKWTKDFVNAQYEESPEANKHHRAIAVSLCARTRNEITIRNKFKELINYTPKFYHKENWGKCVLFEYKGRTLMADSSNGYFVHNPNSYSLDQAKPRFK